jgi:hypothetical protein
MCKGAEVQRQLKVQEQYYSCSLKVHPFFFWCEAVAFVYGAVVTFFFLHKGITFAIFGEF